MPNPKLEQNTIRATYRIVTPMFCGGAEQQDARKSRYDHIKPHGVGAAVAYRGVPCDYT